MIKIKQKAAIVEGGSDPAYTGDVKTIYSNTSSPYIIIPKDQTVDQNPTAYVDYQGHTGSSNGLLAGNSVDLGDRHNIRYFTPTIDSDTYTLTSAVSNLDLGESNKYRFITTSNMRTFPTGTFSMLADNNTSDMGTANYRYLNFSGVEASNSMYATKASTWTRGNMPSAQQVLKNSATVASWSPTAYTLTRNGWWMWILSISTGGTAQTVDSRWTGFTVQINGTTAPFYTLDLRRSDRKYSFYLKYGWFYGVKGTKCTWTITNSGGAASSLSTYCTKWTLLFPNSAPYYWVPQTWKYYNATDGSTGVFNLINGVKGAQEILYLQHRSGGASAPNDHGYISWNGSSTYSLKSIEPFTKVIANTTNSSGSADTSTTMTSLPFNGNWAAGTFRVDQTTANTSNNCAVLVQAKVYAANQFIG